MSGHSSVWRDRAGALVGSGRPNQAHQDRCCIPLNDAAPNWWHPSPTGREGGPVCATRKTSVSEHLCCVDIHYLFGFHFLCLIHLSGLWKVRFSRLSYHFGGRSSVNPSITCLFVLLQAKLEVQHGRIAANFITFILSGSLQVVPRKPQSLRGGVSAHSVQRELLPGEEQPDLQEWLLAVAQVNSCF